VKSIKAGLKLYKDKDHHANPGPDSQSGDIDDRVIPVPDQAAECGFEIAFKHADLFYIFFCMT
jgi:hypothetical protein